MRFRNNNGKAIRQIGNAYYHKNRRKNFLLIGTIITAIFLIYSAFSVGKGKIQTDYLVTARAAGSVASVRIEDGSKAQVQQLKKMTYLSAVGIEKKFGKITLKKDTIGELVYLDQTVYEKMKLPAMTNLHGKYPEKANEIMLPLRILQQLGLSKNSIGKKIQLTFQLETRTTTQNFLLSGSYQEYADPSTTLPQGFVSEEYLTQHHLALFPANLLVMQQGDYTGEAIEKRLYNELPMVNNTQQIVGMTDFQTQAVNGIFGSYGIAFFISLIILFAMYLLLYNLLSISLDSQLREYGLLKVLGTTNKQLLKIIFYQTGKNLVIGEVIGGIGSYLAVSLMLPLVLKKLYLTGFGSIEEFVMGDPLLLIFTLLAVAGMLLLATGHVVSKLAVMSPLNALHFVEVPSGKKKAKINKRGISIFTMGIKNALRSKRKFAVTIGSLFLGSLVGLGGFVLIEGTNTVNEIKQNPDFTIISFFDSFYLGEKEGPVNFTDRSAILPETLISEIKHSSFFDHKKSQAVKGSYVKIDLKNQAALAPRYLANKQESFNTNAGTIQVVDTKTVQKLKKYVQQLDYQTDFSSFEKGEGVFLLHHHLLSKQLEVETEDTLGQPIDFFSVTVPDAKLQQTKPLAALKCSGYLDNTSAAFPKFTRGSNGTDINYFIMTEKAFEKVSLPIKYFSFDLWQKSGSETQVRQELTHVVQKANQEMGEADMIGMFANSDSLEAEKNNSQSTQFVLLVVCSVLIFAGLLNYFNTLQSNLILRRKEFILMEILGLTSRQLWRLVLTEGLFYWFVFTLSQLVIGRPLLQLFGSLVKRKLPYFKFEFPWSALVGLLLGMFIICLLSSFFVYRKTKEQSVIK
ncbi:ABC transporter permease [Enterococcus massiliensis]|uniref:ABC transporter permease n=1 Tax=Enterococcus massiliensis TaxID=1640685 RepID=UPI00065E97F1|nr:ABC transporter permease [Enterococcus massiliensis]